MKLIEYLISNELLKSGTLIHEMTSTQLSTLSNVLHRMLKSFNINLVTTTHSLQRLIGSTDPSRAKIDALDFYETMKKFCEKESRNFNKYKQNRKEYIAVITNSTSKLNLVVSIDYDKRPEMDKFHNMKIITAMIKGNFGSDNYPTSNRVVVD